MDFDTLYQEVLARPEDDAARRVLAEFLSEEGDPLGDFIRVQCDLAEKGAKAGRGPRVTEAKLLTEHHKAWQARFAPWAYEVSFSRGFPALAWTNVTHLRQHGGSGTLPPSVGLVIELERHDMGGELWHLPLFERVTTLELSRGLIRGSRNWPALESFWELIDACPRLTALHLDEVHVEADVRRLLKLKRLGELTELSLRGLNVIDEVAEPLFEALGRSKSLRALDLTGAHALDGRGVRPLVRLVERSDSLRQLMLDHCMLPSQSLRPLTQAVHRKGRAVVSVSRNWGLAGDWNPDPQVNRSVRADPDERRLWVQSADPARPPLGQIGTWELIDLVGHSNGRAYWLARSAHGHGLLRHEVNSASSTGPSANELSITRSWLERAAHTVVGLGHANLVRWLDYGVHGPGVFVVYELGDFLPALEVIDQYRDRGEGFTTAQVARIGLDVCRGLLALHQTGHLHGAVNETTVFLTPNGSARLLPLVYDAPAYRGPMALRFLSPEQVTGQAIGPGSDLFQLGVLMHTLIHQQHPFARPREDQMLDAIAGRGDELPRPLPASVPPALREYLERLIATDWRFRPDSAEEVLMELAMRSNLPLTPAAQPPPPDDLPWIHHALTLARTFSLWGPVEDRRD